jgi:hypothetical protein
MKHMTFRLLLSLVAVMLLAACGTADHGHSNGHEGDGHEHTGTGDSMSGHGDRIPNNGAVVHIVAPAAGETFAQGDQIVVEIETENFVLGEDGNHWHLYVNGESWGMIMGANNTEVVRGLTPGEHEISVYLSIYTHEDLEDGDAVTVIITD